MKVALGQIVQDLKRQSVKRRMSFTVILVLSLFVSTGIVWKLRSVGITMVNDAECGIEEHVHDESCYLHELICGIDDTSDSDDTIGSDDENAENIHVHDINCFTEEFICDKEEHSHNLECFGDESLVEKLKDKKDDGIQVVEIPGVQIAENTQSDDSEEQDEEITEDTEEADDMAEDTAETEEEGNQESEDSETEEDTLSEDEYKRILEQLAGNRGSINLLNELAYVANPAADNDNFYYVNNNNNYTINTPFTMYKGETVEFCIYGSDMTDEHPYTGNSYVSVSNDTSHSDSAKRRAKITADKGQTGETTVYVNLWKDHGKNLRIDIKDFDYEHNLNKIFLVKDDGSEVVEGTLNIKPGDKATFCIYTDETQTYESKKNNDGKEITETHYIYNQGAGVTADDKDKITRIFPDTREGHEGQNIRRYQVTYTFGQAVDTPINVQYRAVTSYKVNVASNITSFDYSKLYHIYWIDNGVEKLDEIPRVQLGGTLQFCIYTDYTNTYDNGNQYHNIYANSSSINSNGRTDDPNYFVDTRDPSKTDRKIRKQTVNFTFNAIGDYELLYNAVTGHKVYVIPPNINSTEDNDTDYDRILLKNDNKYEKLLNKYTSDNGSVSYNPVYNDNKPYVMEVGESIDLIAYQTGNYGQEYFFSNEGAVLSWTNKVEEFSYTQKDESGNNISKKTRVIRAHVTADSPGTAYFRFDGFMNRRFVIRIDVKEHKMNSTYVVTNLGERNKDKVHERGSTYEPNDNATDNRYILHVDGDYHESVEILIYTEYSNTHQDFWISDSAKSVIKLTTDSVEPHEAEGYKIVKGTVEALSEGTAYVSFQYGDKTYDQFWIEVRSSSDKEGTKVKDMKDHADIEIADGGYYEVNRVIYSDDNITRTEIYEKYDTYISLVNGCDISGIKDDGTSGVLHHFNSTDYTKTGNPGEQQYELNSKQKTNGQELYDRYRVRSAKFDVDITMIPSVIREDVYVNGVYQKDLSTEKILEDIDKPIGSEKVVKNIIFDFEMTSIIDAYNKCSNHSGLDFNVTGCLNEVLTQISFPVEKVFQDENNVVLKDINETFNFQLKGVDVQNGTVVTSEIQSNSPNGKITFSDVYVQRKEGVTEVKYKYTINEIVPDGADENGCVDYPGKDYGIKTDSKSVDIYVKTYLSNGLMKTSYYSNESYTTEFNNNIVFTNTVYKDQLTDIVVNKKWSDGNQNHTGNITFNIYQTDEKGNKVKVKLAKNEVWDDKALVYKDGVFYNGAAQSWSVKIENLPYKQNGHTYSYKVEEVNVDNGYVPVVSYDGNTVTITNTLQNEISISVKKEWYDRYNNPFDKTDGTHIEYNLNRYVIEEEISLNVKIKNIKGDLIQEETYKTKYGGRIELDIYSDRPPALEKSINCHCQQTGKRIIVSDIKYNAEIILNKDLLYYCNFDDEDVYYNYWSRRGDSVVLNYESNIKYSGQAGDSRRSLRVSNRTNTWHGAGVDLSSVLSLGNAYSISARVLCKYPDGVTGEYNGAVKLTLEYYNNSKNEDGFKEIARQNINSENWIHLFNYNFSIPEAANNSKGFKIKAEVENNSNIDIYIDEFIIATANVIVDVSQGGVLTCNNPPSGNTGFSFSEISRDKADTTLRLDCELLKEQKLDYSCRWMHTFSKSDIEKAITDYNTQNKTDKKLFVDGKKYYYVVVEPRLVGYEEPEYTNNEVESNTPSDPIIIKNKQLPSYYLPPTGGEGTIKYTASGMTLIFAASAGIFYRRRRKRKSSA